MAKSSHPKHQKSVLKTDAIAIFLHSSKCIQNTQSLRSNSQITNKLKILIQIMIKRFVFKLLAKHIFYLVVSKRAGGKKVSH